VTQSLPKSGTSPGDMRLVVDLNHCQSYGQCVFAAPTIFRFHGVEALEYHYAPPANKRLEVLRAAAACPVQAITVGSVVGIDNRAKDEASE
jgi:ferredoxin